MLELKLSELDDAKTDLPEKYQDNGAKPTINSQPSPLHSPLKYTSVASAALLLRLCHAHALRPATPPFKRERETSWTSASSAPTACYMVSDRIGCTKI